MFAISRCLKTGSLTFSLSVLIIYGYLWRTKVEVEDSPKPKYVIVTSLQQQQQQQQQQPQQPQQKQQQQQQQEQQPQQQQQQQNNDESVANLPITKLSQPPGFSFTTSFQEAMPFYNKISSQICKTA
jgi:hypothetical protein